MKEQKCGDCGIEILVAKIDPRGKCTNCIMKRQLKKKAEREQKHKPFGHNKMGGANIPKSHIVGQIRTRRDGRLNNGAHNKKRDANVAISEPGVKG